MEKPKYPIESVDNALKLLLRFKEQEVLGVSDAGELLGVAPSTAHRLLAMLQYRGFAVQDERTRTYRAGPALLEIGLKAVRDMSLRERARPALERLSKELNETVHLLVREGADVRFVDGVESSRVVRVTSRIGILLPAHCTAGGKALLAEMSTDDLRELYPASKLPALTPESLTRRSDLERELEQIRDQGYATNLGESESEVAAVGAAIRDQQGRAPGALAVAIVASHLDERRLTTIADEVVDACEEIGTAIE